MYFTYFPVCVKTGLWTSSEMFLCVHICLCKPQCVFCMCYMTTSLCKPSKSSATFTLAYTHYCPLYMCTYKSNSLSIHVSCLSLHRRWVCPSFCLRCWPKTHVCHNLNNIFPQACFHMVSWAITVIAIIIRIILTLVPLFSRSGLTLNAIYADWLDQPGIPKVRKVLLSFGISLNCLLIDNFV